MNKTTVLLTTYNNQNRIMYTLNSLSNQTFKEFELLIIDDGSDDDTLKIVKNYYNMFNDMKIIEKDSNKGLINSLNIGIEESKYDIIIRHDAEDISHKRRVELMLHEFMKNPNISCITTSCFLLSGKYNFIGYLPIIKIKNVNLLLDLNINRIYHAGVLYNKNHIRSAGGYPNVQHCEDYALWKNMRKMNMKFKFLDLPLYAFFRENTGISFIYNYEQKKNYYDYSNIAWSDKKILKSQKNQAMKNYIVFNINTNIKTKYKLINTYYYLLKYLNKKHMKNYNNYIEGYEYL